MARVPTTILLATLAVAAIAVGCGGGSEENSGQSDGADNAGAAAANTAPPGGSSDSTPQLTRDQFVNRTSAICQRGEAEAALELQELQERDKDVVPGRPGVEAARNILFPSLEAQMVKIRGLKGPAGAEEQVEDFFKALDRGMEKIDRRELATSEAIGRALRPAGTLALKYGINGCDYGY